MLTSLISGSSYFVVLCYFHDSLFFYGTLQKNTNVIQSECLLKDIKNTTEFFKQLHGRCFERNFFDLLRKLDDQVNLQLCM